MCLRYLKSQLSEFFMSAIFFLFLNQKMDCIKISFFFFNIYSVTYVNLVCFLEELFS